MKQQTEEFLDQTLNRDEKPRLIMHDRDTKFTKEFVQVLQFHGVRTNALPVASPNLNGRVERFIQTIKHECLSKFILFGQRHLDHIVREWVDYYNNVRSHTERGNLPPVHTPPEEVTTLNPGQVVIKSYVGGLVQSFERKAA